ncbi:MAG: PQQ-binding-like beta-propeller repeat protein [Myxococcota bacterium]
MRYIVPMRVPPPSGLWWALGLLVGCERPVPAPPDAPAIEGPGVVRLGPPAPSVGIYGIAAPPGTGRVYVSNLHVPFLTVVDAATGAWLDAVDLREGCGDHAFFPRLFVVGDVLWITDTEAGRLCRYDHAEGAWLDPVDVDGLGGGIAVSGSDLWVATRTALLRHDGTDFVETIPAPGWASALDVEGDTFALLMGPDERVAVLDRAGAVAWEADVPGRALNDIALLDGRVYVTERVGGHVIALADGAEIARLHTGSDTFEVDRFGDGLLVTNRQGAALPSSGAYQGDPSLVTAFNADLTPRWSVPLDKTIHFLAWDGVLLWAANEDALRLSAIDPVAGVEVLRTEPLGLTVDHLAEVEGALVFGSHLTDEVWRVTRDGRAIVATVCGWPFVAVPVAAGLVVPCQEDGDVWTLDPITLEVRATMDVADTFFPVCAEGLCTGHDTLVAAAADGDAVVYSDPHTGSVRWTDGRVVDLGDFPVRGDLHHFDVAAVQGAVLAFEPRTETLYAVTDPEAALPLDEPTATFALIPDGDRVWAGGAARDATLAEVARLPEGFVALVAGEGWIVAQDGEDLVTLDHATLVEAGRVAIEALRAPPWRGIDGSLGPLRFRVVGGELIVANTMRGTLERRALPDLGPAGDDEVVPAGRWAHLDGLR